MSDAAKIHLCEGTLCETVSHSSCLWYNQPHICEIGFSLIRVLYILIIIDLLLLLLSDYFHRPLGLFSLEQVELIRRDYVATGGWETFLSYEDPEQDILIGLLRLRKCTGETFRPELKGGVSIVRELHVYGSVVPVSSRDPSKFQHQVSTAI